MTLATFFSSIGMLVTIGGGGAVVAIAVFKFLGKSLIQNALAKDLEAAKSEISFLASKKLKFHDREYLVFPEIWSKLNTANRSLGKVTSAYREIPDFKNMRDEELRSWIERSDLDENEKFYFERESDKVRVYSRILDFRDLKNAHLDYIDFYDYLQNNRIFLSLNVKEKMDRIANHMRQSWAAKKMDVDGYSSDAGESYMLEAYDKYEKEVKPLMKEIEELVQSRFSPTNN